MLWLLKSWFHSRAQWFPVHDFAKISDCRSGIMKCFANNKIFSENGNPFSELKPWSKKQSTSHIVRWFSRWCAIVLNPLNWGLYDWCSHSQTQSRKWISKSKMLTCPLTLTSTLNLCCLWIWWIPTWRKHSYNNSQTTIIPKAIHSYTTIISKWIILVSE